MTEPGITNILRRLDRLDAERAIRQRVTRYFDLCDRLGPDVAPAELAALFTEEAEWRGKGKRYSTAFGSKRGRGAIVAMLDSYRGPPAHFTMNAHFLSNETIRFNGAEATGNWMMLQMSAYRDGTCDLRAAKLNICFVELADEWLINLFETENLFSRRVSHWDDAAPILTPNG